VLRRLTAAQEVQKTTTKESQDQSARDQNPNYHAYWESRAYDGRPEDWEERSEDDE
jgi:hypothetical protein